MQRVNVGVQSSYVVDALMHVVAVLCRLDAGALFEIYAHSYHVIVQCI